MSTTLVSALLLVFCAWMKIAVKPATTSSAEGTRPSSSRFRGLSMQRAYLQPRRARRTTPAKPIRPTVWLTRPDARVQARLGGRPVACHAGGLGSLEEVLEALPDRRRGDRAAQRRRHGDRDAEQGHDHRQRGLPRREPHPCARGTDRRSLRWRAPDLPVDRLRQARQVQERLRPRQSAAQRHACCSYAWTPIRGRPRCSRYRAICSPRSSPPADRSTTRKRSTAPTPSAAR